MTNVRLKYLHCFTDRHGKPHHYFRYRGQRWPIPAPGTAGFASAYDALLAQIKADTLQSRHNVEFMPGLLRGRLRSFWRRRSIASVQRPPKRNYRRVLDQLREKYGTDLLRDLKPWHVRMMRNEIASTRPRLPLT